MFDANQARIITEESKHTIKPDINDIFEKIKEACLNCENQVFYIDIKYHNGDYKGYAENIQKLRDMGYEVRKFVDGDNHDYDYGIMIKW